MGLFSWPIQAGKKFIKIFIFYLPCYTFSYIRVSTGTGKGESLPPGQGPARRGLPKKAPREPQGQAREGESRGTDSEPKGQRPAPSGCIPAVPYDYIKISSYRAVLRGGPSTSSPFLLLAQAKGFTFSMSGSRKGLGAKGDHGGHSDKLVAKGKTDFQCPSHGFSRRLCGGLFRRLLVLGNAPWRLCLVFESQTHRRVRKRKKEIKMSHVIGFIVVAIAAAAITFYVEKKCGQ